ncbi:hypothetical protein [Longitalea luteola]|uniref:hypothetical protein n=1 Tax=Longitalea luteola TaxID=2812563 RepID=UPI001A9692C1|nr:hypothetical protein [Longitalea luteola]
MKKLIAVLFFLAIGIKVSGCPAQYSENRHSIFAVPFEESDTKCQQLDSKEKFEEESAVVTYFAIACNSAKSARYIIHPYTAASSHEMEPSFPPPNVGLH